MNSSTVQSKKKTKASKNRSLTTSINSQPVIQDAPYLTALSSFSPNGAHFAFLSLAIDKHRLRVYSTVTGKSAAEHFIDTAHVSTLAWGSFDLSEHQKTVDISLSKKKRRKRESLTVNEDTVSREVEAVILGLSDGSIQLFSPSHGRVLRTLLHPSSTSEILAVAVISKGKEAPIICASGSDGAVRLWDAQKNEIVGVWKSDDRIPYSSLAARPTNEEDRVDVLVSHHKIRLFSASFKNPHSEIGTHSLAASFTGHASPVRQIQWDPVQRLPTHFVSLAESDRFLYIWEVPEKILTEVNAIASIPLDSDARSFSLFVSEKKITSESTLLTLSASGKICLYPIPLEFAPVGSKHRLPTLLPRSNIVTTIKATQSAKVVNATFIEDGVVRVARLIDGIRPIFDTIRYLDGAGEFISEVVLEDVEERPVSHSHLGNSLHRYSEAPTLNVTSGTQLGHGETADGPSIHGVDGNLDIDLTELSLGQRLTALSGPVQPSSGSDDEGGELPTKKRKAQKNVNLVATSSLTRTLIQALHSSDSPLLETCLLNSDQKLIRNTVQRLPPQLALPLIDACVERLSRGARGGNMKGGSGGASSQRGTTLIKWIKTALTVHSGHLMTMPDLVTRLSGLHATFASRLMLQESLLSLSGRLDMIISHIELRSSAVSIPLAPRKEPLETPAVQFRRYVEGESGDEVDEHEDVDIEVESDNEGGSVEDVDLGGGSDDDEEYEEDEDEEEEEEDYDEDSPTINGFIDDEAEEYSDDDDDDDDESE